MSSKKRRANTAIDCDQCSAYNCFNDNSNTDDDAQYREQVTDMIVDLAGCLPSGQYWNNEQLYISAMCSPYGDGVELAVFLDNECTVYTNTATFRNVYQGYIQNNGLADISAFVETHIKSAFEQDMSCQDVQYVHPDEATDDDGNDNVQQSCQQLFADGAMDFSQCYNQGDYDFGNNNNQDDELSWYTYDMTYDEAKDLEDVCTVVYQMSGEYSYSYDEERSGTWYSRDESGSIKKSSSGGVEFSPVAIALLVLLGVGIVGAAAYISYRKSRVRRMEPLYAGGAMI